jgi:O-acetylhomoserine (thiol)-lyase
MSPFNAYLTLTGIETLNLRMQKHMSNAEKVANFLIKHNKVDTVSWSGFQNNKSHKLAKKYFKFGFGSVFTFSVKSGYDGAKKVVENCNLFSHLANVGDTKSLIIHPASTTHRQLSSEQREISGAGDSVIRVSIGIEHSDDIIKDLKTTLDNL